MAAVLLNGAQILKCQNTGIVGVALLRINNYSTEKSYNLSQLKRGSGGRSSFSGIVATVFGATGFLGSYVVSKLCKIGSQVIIPYRADPHDILRLKVAGDLGQVLFQPFDLRDEESIEKALKYSNVVINLIGREYETKSYKFKDVNVIGPATIAKIAKRAGVEKFIHFSALNASKNPPPIMLKNGSQFLISKYHGEQAVLEHFPTATIFRPSDIYGQEDRFLRYYAHAWRRHVHCLSLWKKGESTIKQPVYVADVAAGIINAIKDPEAKGKVYQAVGPKRYYLSDLVDWFLRIMRKDDEWGYARFDMRFDPIFYMKVFGTNLVSISYPIANLHWERVEREHITDTLLSGVPTLEDLSVNLTNMEDQVPWELRPYTTAMYHGHAADEPFPHPPPPKIAT